MTEVLTFIVVDYMGLYFNINDKGRERPFLGLDTCFSHRTDHISANGIAFWATSGFEPYLWRENIWVQHEHNLISVNWAFPAADPSYRYRVLGHNNDSSRLVVGYAPRTGNAMGVTELSVQVDSFREIRVVRNRGILGHVDCRLLDYQVGNPLTIYTYHFQTETFYCIDWDIAKGILTVMDRSWFGPALCLFEIEGVHEELQQTLPFLKSTSLFVIGSYLYFGVKGGVFIFDLHGDYWEFQKCDESHKLFKYGEQQLAIDLDNWMFRIL